ncbi:MAG TPA: PIN domain-containing protein [Alphaproteobacteria bacterium]|jgi:predicted nucleic acid-binding protein
MAVVLLDTSVASMFLPERRVRAERSLYEPHLSGNTLALCFQSAAELWKLAEKNGWSQRRCDALDAFIRRFLVIPYDYGLTRVWARVTASEERAGRPFETADAWIAATAVHRELPLYAHDSDFLGRSIAGLNVVSFMTR